MLEMKQHQIQKLIDFKNKLMEESDMQYSEASIEEDKIEETRLLAISTTKMNIAKLIEDIIYNK